MKRSAIYLTLLCLFYTTNAISQKDIEFKTTKTNTLKEDIKTMLITGIGKTPARVFLDNLGDEMGKSLKSKGIETNYQFLGADINVANDELNRLAAEKKFDGILIINQSDTSVSERINHSGYLSVPISPYVPNIPLAYSPLFAGKSKILFDQQFQLRLFEKDQSSSTWDANLIAYADLSKKSVYRNVTDKIIKSLQDNRIFW